MTPGGAAWADAALAAALLAIDPSLGGACLRVRTGPAQAAWLDLYRRLDPERTVLRLPPGIGDERLFGGLDLAATLASGKPVMTEGLLRSGGARAMILPMAERASAGLAARLAVALDAGCGATLTLLDEGADDAEFAPAALTDRLAFLPRLDAVRMADLTEGVCVEDVRRARALLGRVETPPEAYENFVKVAVTLGILSMRAPLLALAAARAAIALAGETRMNEAAAILAARLVLGPRAKCLPETPPEEDMEEPEEPSAPDDRPDTGEETDPPDPNMGRIPEEILLEAARAAIPPDIIARLLGRQAFAAQSARTSGAGDERKSRAKGRPAGSVRGRLTDGGQLDLVETLRAAAPWQPLRRREGTGDRVIVLSDDFRIKRSKQRTEKVLIFAVDASGSTALSRLAETKGAVELMLGQAYVERQQVALIAFRGTGAEVLLPPTRSLVLTKRRLASLPGGGGTPLAAGLNSALELARSARSRGMTPYLALLTDGKANIALDGAPGRTQAETDVLRLARLVSSEGLAATVIDTGNRPTPAARVLADTMGATYLPLPRADARALAGAMTSALAGG